jgi:hypothetical protein
LHACNHIDGLPEETHMTTQLRPPAKKLERLDVKKAEAIIKKLVRENKEWLKEMADK